nr:alpha/beta fold hydrolase [Streptomyces sp. SM11]
METSGWIRRFHPAPAAPVRLVCFPHAGGSASYYFPVSKALSSVADVQVLQYPGRQDRLAVPFTESMDELADTVTAVLRQRPDLPLALFGHSMGATLAFEVAARLEREGVDLLGFFASGRRAPASVVDEQVHSASDAQLISHVKKLSGNNALDDPDIADMVLPAIRSDYRSTETYRYRPGTRLTCPLYALTGDNDPQVSPVEAREWGEYTTGPFEMEVFEGGHFFFDTAPREPLDYMARRLADLAA